MDRYGISSIELNCYSRNYAILPRPLPAFLRANVPTSVFKQKKPPQPGGICFLHNPARRLVPTLTTKRAPAGYQQTLFCE